VRRVCCCPYTSNSVPRLLWNKETSWSLLYKASGAISPTELQ
jgi:Ni,Fe-hydrogenase I small subunit